MGLFILYVFIIGVANAISESSNHGHLDQICTKFSLPGEVQGEMYMTKVVFWFTSQGWKIKYLFGLRHMESYREKGIVSLSTFYGFLCDRGLWVDTPLVFLTDCFHFFKGVWLVFVAILLQHTAVHYNEIHHIFIGFFIVYSVAFFLMYDILFRKIIPWAIKNHII